MKILFAIQKLDKKLGGAERFTTNLVKSMLKRGHDITIACYSWDKQYEEQGIRFIRIKKPGFLKDPWEEYSKSLKEEIEKLDEKPDIVCGLTQTYPQDVHRFAGGIYAYWLPKKYPKTWFFQKFMPRNRRILQFEKKIYAPQNLRYAVAISEMDKALLEKYYAFPEERIITIYNGIDQTEFHNNGREETRQKLTKANAIDPKLRIVLFSANNYKRKGLPEAVEAILKTKDPSRFALVVIGKPDKALRSSLKRKIGDKFRNVWLSRVDDPAEYYRGADLMLFPTHYDSFANVTAEAMLCGLPLITTKDAGGSEMVTQGVNGFVVEDSSKIKEMAEALDLLLDEEKLKSFSLNAPNTAKDLTTDRCAANFEALFQKILEERKNGG
ncbi:glycosyltransferase family 4 protein [bacterium]|nr:glycosyltransferase family 4 protein [bacterium]